MNNLVFATMQELATGIRQRRVSATEVLEDHLAQIARHNPALHAIVTLDEERARRWAQDADAALARGDVWGPLHGVPMGGGRAAVAAGLSPLEIGSDFGGSVRIPAHYCGVYALKPTEHRVPGTGHIPELPGAPHGVRHMPRMGPMARSVEDLRLALRLIAGPDGQEWEVPPVPLEPVPDRPLRAYRLAWTDDFGGVPITADTQMVLARVAGELQRLGTPIEHCGPPGIRLHHSVGDVGCVVAGGNRLDHVAGRRRDGDPHRRR
jgi:Asp-tRNA(Asn)/Glu-tRNA(Gln) amidotransferase A subunit family amidase